MSVDIDFLLLADGAHVAGDKLYVLGGGWTVVSTREFPMRHAAAIAVGAMVAWDQTNQRHALEIVLMSEDGQQVAEPLLSGEFDVGRPPGIRPGTSQRFMVAAAVSLELSAPGAYSIVTRVDGTDMRHAVFTALQVPAAAPAAT